MKIITVSEPAIQKVDANAVPLRGLRVVTSGTEFRPEHYLATFVLTYDPGSVPNTELTCQSRIEVAISSLGPDATFERIERQARGEIAPLLRSLAEALSTKS